MIAAALVFVWQAATVHFNYQGNWTGLFCTGASLRVPPDLDAATLRSVHPIGYDGQFYRYIAHDPFFQRGYAPYVDDPQLRYRRILVPMLAYFIAGGRQSIIDFSFVAVILLSVFACCYWSSCYSVHRGKSPWWGLLFLALPATITSVDRMLVDAMLAALFAGFLLYAERRDWPRLLAVCALAALTRETGLLLPAAVVMAALLKLDFRRAVLAVSALLPVAAWAVFVSRHTGPSGIYSLATYPLLGHLQRFLVLRTDPTPWVQTILRVSDVAALVALLACLGLAAYAIRREPVREIQICVGLFVILGMVMGSPYYLTEPYGYSRPISPLLLFLMLRQAPFGLLAPLPLTLAVGLNIATQVIGVVKGLLR